MIGSNPQNERSQKRSAIEPSDPKILVALDFDNIGRCIRLAEQLDPRLCRLKIGKEMFTLYGPSVIEQLHRLDFEVFLDLKFHDIPATVAKAVKAASALGVWMVNVHASGGTRMMDAACEAIANERHRPLLVAVTVLTSMTAEDLSGVGVTRTPPEQVRLLASLSKHSGMDGVVCSAHEAQCLKDELGSEFVLVTPGIRPTGGAANDQRRIMTPAEAVAAGSHYLVIGRPITQASDPIAVCESIAKSIEQS